MSNEIEAWIRERGIGEIECLVPDMNGVVRGKVYPAQKFVTATQDGSLRLPSSIFALTLTGEYAQLETGHKAHRDPDMMLHPDPATLCVAPGYATPTAFVFADTTRTDGVPWEASPRHVLKRISQMYADKGWTPVVAPELEFYLTAVNPAQAAPKPHPSLMG
jgi:glutamine synthetase